jgi:(1->4)-alpha-D-glucan 1-alpha-D-glucosylmutase
VTLAQSEGSRAAAPDRRPPSGATPAEGARVEEIAEALYREEAGAALRRPVSTYRLQLHAGFRFRDAEAIVPYLDELGISDCYFSPYLHARPGSLHGYDVFDHGSINPEIGDEEDDARLAAALQRRGMGRVLDIVPNHMGIAGPNRYWQDVLESGPYAASARFFDIDWHPVKEELENRVLLPILEDAYGKVLGAGLIALERDGGAFFLRYHDRRLPVAPRSYALILGHRSPEFLARFDPEDEHVQEYQSIWAAAQNLSDRRQGPALRGGIRHEKDVIKRRLDRLCRESPALRAFLDENVAALRGTPGVASSFDALDHLLERQVYRLAYWRVAADEINYRRFFDVNDLAGIRVEDPAVFDAVHRRIVDWVGRGRVTGLRVDHPDGLADPVGYLERLQQALLLASCRRRFEMAGHDADWDAVATAILERDRAARRDDPGAPAARRFPIVVEKILSRGEELPDDWPVDGTVGYEFLNALHGLFVDSSGMAAIEDTYAEFTGDRDPISEVVYVSKQLILRTALSSELNMLARALNRISESDRNSRDFTLNDLRRMLREIIACFPVYRTYVHPARPPSAQDPMWIDQAVARARRRNPTTDSSVFAFLRSALLLEHPPGTQEADREAREAFVRRFQQTTGPAQAKGLEDTTFYRSLRLASLNEVGADPSRNGVAPQAFHALNAQRLRQWPGGLSTTATHDTKRGEDTRLRIDVLSEIPDEWRTNLGRWSYWNARMKPERDGQPVPDPREEYLLYQSMVGAWPFEPGGGDGDDDRVPDGLVARFQEYAVKAAREAKVNTSWTDSDDSYAGHLRAFIAAILEGPDRGPFLRTFLPFQRRVARVAVVHSLGQALLKVASPGVPDVYQGTELWDFSLVDPDNRRPVDYAIRRRLLERLRGALESGQSRDELARSLFAAPGDGAIKLYVTATALRHRRDEPDLYALGAYRPIEAEGGLKNHVIAFGRSREGQHALVAASRLVARLMGPEGTQAPIGPDTWTDTRLILPEAPLPRLWRDRLTDRLIAVEDGDGASGLALAQVFHTLPVALLVPEPS